MTDLLLFNAEHLGHRQNQEPLINWVKQVFQ